MSKILVAVLLTALTYSLTGCGQMLPSAMPSSDKSFNARTSSNFAIQEELLVKFKSQVNASSIQIFHAQHGTRTLRVIPGVNVHVMSITSGKSISQVLAQVNKSPMVEYAEVNKPINLNDGQPRL